MTWGLMESVRSSTYHKYPVKHFELTETFNLVILRADKRGRINSSPAVYCKNHLNHPLWLLSCQHWKRGSPRSEIRRQ